MRSTISITLGPKALTTPFRTMRLIFTPVAFCGALLSNAQGYPAEPVEWPIPTGGYSIDGTTYGFNYVNEPSNSLVDGIEAWVVMDMNGDELPDLVSTGIRTAGSLDPFSSGTTPCWHVYLNDGSSFSTEATLWTLPPGGRISATENGFCRTAALGGDEGSQSWGLGDLNGDGRPDLIVVGEMIGGTSTGYSGATGWHWRVHFNDGTGFAVDPVEWILPEGGRIQSGIPVGFTALSAQNVGGSLITAGSDYWALMDLHGDGLQDLVVFSELDGASEQAIAFEAEGSGFWKVHRNDGGGFMAEAEPWGLPEGGGKFNTTDLGFNLSYRQQTSAALGSENWQTNDINGDGHPDLIVSSSRTSGGRDAVQMDGTTPFWKVFINTGSAFSTEFLQWSLPEGGLIDEGVEVGYIMAEYQNVGSFDVGSLYWYFEDMDADRLPDLVVTAEKTSATAPTMSGFGLPDQYWTIHGNTGTGFSTDVWEWSIPVGGAMSDGTYRGFLSFDGAAVQSGSNVGQQAWSIMDIDNSGTGDLVLTGQVFGGSATSVFGTVELPYWNVHLNPFAVGQTDLGPIPTSIGAFPNPTSDIIRLVVDQSGAIRTSVFDQTGSLVVTSTGSVVDLSGLHAGMYTLRVRLADGTVQHLRIVRQ